MVVGFQLERRKVNFKFKRNKRTAKQEEYIDKQVKKFPRTIFYVFLVYFVLFAIYIGWYIYFRNTYELSEVDGTSMQNTLNPNISSENDGDDLVYINTIKQLERFDIVVINDKNADGSDIKLIKRVIGMPGDYVTIKKADDGYFHVFMLNYETGEIYSLNESYVKSYSDWTYGPDSVYDSSVAVLGEEYELRFYETFIANPQYAQENVVLVEGVYFFKVPDNEIFYLGDNRGRSSDSRVRGTAKLEKVEGVAEIILPGGAEEGVNLLAIKVEALFSYYWNRLENFFSR